MPAPGNLRQVDPNAVDWFSGARATTLMAVEQHELIPALTGVHGRHALYVRPGREGNVDLSGHLLGDVLKLHADSQRDGWSGDLQAATCRLPIADESLALVYLLHSLDHQREPGRFLAEVARVLAPEGCLISVGLNPFSPWAWRWMGRGPSGHSPKHVLRWIEMAGLSPLKLYRLGPWSPFSEPHLARSVGSKNQGSGVLRAGFAWCARKRVAGLTPDAKALRDRARMLRGRTSTAPNAG